MKQLVGGNKKKKKKAKGPFYEQIWFLSLCLISAIGVTAWLLWPASEAELYAGAKTLMDQNDPANWDEARENYITPLLAKFPASPHGNEAREWIDMIDMAAAEEAAPKRLRLPNYKPKSDGERLYLQALAEEKEDRIVAINKYRSLVTLLSSDDGSRIYVKLAKKRALELESQIGGDEKFQLVNKALRDAENQLGRGDLQAAREIWRAVVELYGTSLELQPQVSYAEARLNGDTPPPLNFGSDP